MKIATFNANSIRTRMEIIAGWLEKEYPDLLCLQETKVQDKDFPVKSLEKLGYKAIFRGQKSYNGVAIVSRLSLDETRLRLYEGEDEQARFLSARSTGIFRNQCICAAGFCPRNRKV